MTHGWMEGTTCHGAVDPAANGWRIARLEGWVFRKMAEEHLALRNTVLTEHVEAPAHQSLPRHVQMERECRNEWSNE